MHSGDKFDIQYSFDLSSLGTNLCSLHYSSYTNNGNVASISNNVTGMSGRSQQFCYDALNRIQTAQTASTYSTGPSFCWAEAYTIDSVANLKAITQVTNNYNGSYVGCSEESGFSTTINSSNNQDALSCYDVAGNKVGASSGGSCSPLPTTYIYDAENRLISTGGETYTYDGDSNRVEKSGETLYWYGPTGEVLAETNTTGGDQNEYVFFAGNRTARVNSSGNVFYYFADNLGTSRVNVQDGSTPTLCYDADFYPYGGERTPYTNTCGQNYKFTGKERDSESGLDYFGARYDSSQYGRFMTPDEPLADQDAGDPQSWNLYTYVRNNPLLNTDEDGRACVQQKDGSWKDDASGGQTCADASDPSQRQVASAVVTPSRDELNLMMLQSVGENLSSPAQLADVARHGMEGAMIAEGVIELPSTVRGIYSGLKGLGALTEEWRVARALRPLDKMGHALKHLEEFKKLDPSLTREDVAKILTYVKENFSGTTGSFGSTEHVGQVAIGGKEVTVKVVASSSGNIKTGFVVQ